MSKVLVIIKSRGIGDLCILSKYIQEISKHSGTSVSVLAQKNTRADEILKNDPHIKEVLELDGEGLLLNIKKIKSKNFDQVYIYSDSIRLYLISKLSGIKNIFHYKFFSKKGKNFFKTAKEFTEIIINKKISSQTKLYYNLEDVNNARQKFTIDKNVKNIICGISASGPTKRWDITNYIELFKNLSKKFKCKFFLAAGPKDQELINKIMNSSIDIDYVSFSKMNISQTLPIIAACQYYIGNDTGWGHLCSGLNLKSLFLFCDSPPKAYAGYSDNISIILPDGETIESCGHNTRGKDKISFDNVLSKSLKLLN